MDNLNKKLDNKNEAIHGEKQKRRAESAEHVETRKAVELTVDKLYKWIDELHVELSEARSTVKAAQKDAKSDQTKLNKAKTVAYQKETRKMQKKLDRKEDEINDDRLKNRER